MENKMMQLDDSELEQVTGGKSFSEWKAYLDSIQNLSTSEIRSLIIKVGREIRNDPDLSNGDKKFLEHLMDGMWGVERFK